MDEQLAQDVRDAMDRVQAAMDRLIAQQRALLLTGTEEYGHAANDTVAVAYPVTRNVVKVRVVHVYTSVGTATLTLGQYSVPIPNTGWTSLQPLPIYLRANDTRKVTAGSAGVLHLLVLGDDCMDQGA